MTISVGGADISLDELEKQKVQNRFDEDMLNEDVQICSDLKSDYELLQIDNMAELSNQQKLEKLMRCNKIC